MTIAILLTLCSKKQPWNKLGDCDFLQIFLQGFFETISFKHKYRFYVGYDDNDEFFLKNENILKKRLHKDDVVLKLPSSKTNGNPCEAWNILGRRAIEDKDIEYLYQVGTDIYHLSKNWDDYFVRTLTIRNNKGIVGGVDKQFYLERALRNLQGIIENGFFHRTHIEKLNTIFNAKLKTWFSDDYLTSLYEDYCYICPWIEFRNINRVGDSNELSRYKPDREVEKIWEKLAVQDRRTLFDAEGS